MSVSGFFESTGALERFLYDPLCNPREKLNGEVTAADSLVDGWLGSIPFLELSAPIRRLGARPSNPRQSTFRPVTFHMSSAWRVSTACPLVPRLIAYLPVQTLFTLHDILLNSNAVMDNKVIAVIRNKLLYTSNACAATIRALMAQKSYKCAD
jgi:hypothetical protein